MKYTSLLMLSAFSVLALSACGTGMERELEDNARYWQRKDTTDAIYQQGPKAQQMLFQDIANCTATIKELKQLNAIRNDIPEDTFDSTGMRIKPDSHEGRMAKLDNPPRQGYMRTEYYDYSDFEGCMTYKGWERVKYNNFKTVDRARADYIETLGIERYRTEAGERNKKAGYND